jgi:hypothetical protein
MHAVLEEGQQHFFSEDDVYYWLRWQSYNGRRALVYTSDGLVVLWEMQNSPSNKFSAISVDVWQIYIQGKKPTNLKGARDESVIIINRKMTPFTSVGGFQPNAAQQINGRWYTGKALDIMNDQKISPQQVENVILNSAAKRKEDGGGFFYLNPESFSMPMTVSTDTSGKVLLAH